MTRRITRRQALGEMLAGHRPDRSRLRHRDRAAARSLRLDAAHDLPGPGRHRSARPRARRAAQASRPNSARQRSAVGAARDDRARHRRPRARCRVPGAGHVPRPPRAAVSVDLPPAGNADRAGAGRSAVRDPGARARRRNPRRRPDRQRPGKRARPRAGGPERRARAAREAARRATSGSSPRSTPTPSTTGPTSTPRATRVCSRRRRVRFTSPGVSSAWYSGARRPRHPRRRRDRAHAADPRRSRSATRRSGISRRA